MQLTNIARDVGEDARAGRLYLPADDLRAGGVDLETWMTAPAPVEAVRRAVRALLDDADQLYASAWPGIRDLPPRCRPAIRAAALVYAEIGRKVREAEYDSVTQSRVDGQSRESATVGSFARAPARERGPRPNDPSRIRTASSWPTGAPRSSSPPPRS